MKAAMYETNFAGGLTYFVNYENVFYFWSPVAKRWYRAISQANQVVIYRDAINNGRAKRVRLKVMRGIDSF